MASGQRLLFLRNPWGREKFDGDWSDFDSERWTTNKRRQRKIPTADDGLFYISVEDYLKHMDYTYINYDTTNWYHAYFMMWGDPAERNGSEHICGLDCTQHRLYVESRVK